MSIDHINYPQMIDQSMRQMVREVLRKVQAQGLPSEHHFFISFRTQFSGVKMSDQLREKYPHEITIVIQHQFWDFKVEDHQFHVTLSFGGAPEKLTVPFAALTAFADPSIKFGLQFQFTDGEALFAGDATEDSAFIPERDATLFQDADESEINEENSKAEIISLDAFRKK